MNLGILFNAYCNEFKKNNQKNNVPSGEGLIRVRNSLVPFRNRFPKDTELYKLMTTKLEEVEK